MPAPSSSSLTPGQPGCVAVIVAAGRGSRAGTDQPKQYVNLGGEPLIRRTLQAFCSHPAIDAVLPVIHPNDTAMFSEAAAGLSVMSPVFGGDSRQESVRLGLESLASLAEHPQQVLIHDAARAFISASLIANVVDALSSYKAAIPALRVVDTLKRESESLIVGETVERHGLWRAQTPQGFHFSDILSAHRAFKSEALTDDSAVAERAGIDVALVEGEEDNVKITTAADFEAAQQKLSNGETRIGSGFDVHRFCPGGSVVLCGVHIPHTQALEGHSDADVAMHALTDALLGAMAEGDIGSHFPPSEAQWEGASSDIFMRHAANLLTSKGGRIINLDVTIICESPKVGPYRDAMRDNLAALFRVHKNRVSIKATTTEKLGFTGRGEGIAAQAIATITLP